MACGADGVEASGSLHLAQREDGHRPLICSRQWEEVLVNVGASAKGQLFHPKCNCYTLFPFLVYCASLIPFLNVSLFSFGEAKVLTVSEVLTLISLAVL